MIPDWVPDFLAPTITATQNVWRRNSGSTPRNTSGRRGYEWRISQERQADELRLLVREHDDCATGIAALVSKGKRPQTNLTERGAKGAAYRAAATTWPLSKDAPTGSARLSWRAWGRRCRSPVAALKSHYRGDPQEINSARPLAGREKEPKRDWIIVEQGGHDRPLTIMRGLRQIRRDAQGRAVAAQDGKNCLAPAEIM